MPIYAFPSFHDLKKHVAHEGGFSDGGVLCGSVSLGTAAVDIIAPGPGLALGGFDTPAGEYSTYMDTNACLLVINFDTVNSVQVQLEMVLEDGTVLPLGGAAASPFVVGAGLMVAMPLQGLIPTYPNKVRARLVAGQGYTLPTKRVLCKTCMVEYDKPADLEA